MKQINIIFKTVVLFIAVFAGAVFNSCTDRFGEYNTNPGGPTQEQIRWDNTVTGVLVQNMMPVLSWGHQNKSQMMDQMIGSEYGGHVACIATWGNGGNYYTYNPKIGWYGNVFDEYMPVVYTNYFQIVKETQAKGPVFALATILRIFGTLRVSDTYGPVPYSKITGSEFNVAYDNMPELYNKMFEDLDKSLDAIQAIVSNNEDVSSIAQYDNVYNGDLKRWLKFGNTLKLRMAMRLVNVNLEQARQKAEEAVIGGVFTEAADAAWNRDNDGMNPYYRAAYTWNGGELRVSANLSSYLDGYNDPRFPVYVKDSKDYGKVGVRNGIKQTEMTYSDYQKYSNLNIGQNDPLIIMSASEAYFLRAEGKLRGWNMQGEAKELYNKGVEISMKERGVAIGNYLDSDVKPANYVDPENSAYNKDAATDVGVMYDEGAEIEKNLERIMIQKWLAAFPNGWETWVDIRRTGYPKFFPIVNNLSADGVDINKGMRRLRYPASEYNTNKEHVLSAVNMLGGQDKASTDLWWAKK